MARRRTGQDMFLRGAPEGLAVIPVPVYELALYELLRAYGDGLRRTEAAVLTIEPAEFYSMDDALSRLARFMDRVPNWRGLASVFSRGLRGGGVCPPALAPTFAATPPPARTRPAELPP